MNGGAWWAWLQLDCGCRVAEPSRARPWGPGDDFDCEVHGNVEVADVLAR